MTERLPFNGDEPPEIAAILTKPPRPFTPIRRIKPHQDGPTTEEMLANINRSLPFSDEAERGVIAGILQNFENRIEECRAQIPPEAMYHSANQIIYAELCEFADRSIPMDIGTLTFSLREKKLLDKVGGPGAISELFSFMPATSHFELYRKIVMEKWLLRGLVNASCINIHTSYEHGSDYIDEDIQMVLDEAEERVRAVRDRSHGGKFRSISDWVAETEESISAQIDKARNLTLSNEGGGSIPGLSTGIAALDDATNGLCPGHAWIIAGGYGDGKTGLAAQMVASVAADAHPACFYLTESSGQDWVKRLAAARSRVDLKRIIRGELTDAEAKAVSLALREIARWPLHLRHLPGLTDVALLSDMRFMMRRHKIRVFAVDYLQNIECSSKRRDQTDADALRIFMKKIVDLTAQKQVTTIVLSQLSDDRKLAGAKAIAAGAEIVCTMQAPLLPGEKVQMIAGERIDGKRDYTKREIKFTKARMADSRGNKLTFNFNGATQTFS